MMSNSGASADNPLYDRPADQPLPTPVDFEFPHQPYAIQQQFMTALYECIERRQIGIFESPTGTGKSLSLMCAALRWQSDHERTFRRGLDAEIAALQREIQSAERADATAGGSGDWLTAQSGTIMLKQRLVALRAQREQVRKADEEQQLRRDRQKQLEQRAKARVVNRKGSKATSLGDGLLDANDDAVDEFAINNEDAESDDDGDDDIDAAAAENPPKPFNPQIFFCSRTHSQLSQIVHEVRKTVFAGHSEETGVRIAVLGSRQNYCINAAVQRLGSGAQINERCLEMQKCGKTAALTTKSDLADGIALKKRRPNETTSTCRCQHYSQPRISSLSDHILSTVLDIEELVASTRTTSNDQPAGCPYYAARAAARDAQLVLLPYQMLLHRRTRQQTGLDLRNAIVIVDEGHNLIDTMAGMHAAEMRLGQLQLAHRQLLAYKAKYFARFSTANLLRLNQLVFVANRLAKLLEKHDTKIAARMLRTHELLSEADIDTQPLAEILAFCERTRLAQKVQGFAMKFGTAVVDVQRRPADVQASGRAEYLKRLAEKRQQKKSVKTEPKSMAKPNAENVPPPDTTNKEPESTTSVLRPLLAFLDCLLQTSADGRILMSTIDADNTNDDDGSPPQSRRYLKYLLLNPAAHFADVLADCRSVIVAGGTMQPTAELRTQLFAGEPGARISEHFFDHVVDSSAILPLVVAAGPTQVPLLFNYTNRGSAVVLAELRRILANVCAVTPSGVVAFFPSYDYLEQFGRTLERMADGTGLAPIAGKTVFREPRGSSTKCDRMLSDYGRAVRETARGALLLSVVGGKLSEGLNFSDELGRCVIVVGMPFANRTSPELCERMAFLDRKLGSGAGSEYYENGCMKAVNQCIGEWNTMLTHMHVRFGRI